MHALNTLVKYVAVFKDGTETPVAFWEPNQTRSLLNGFGLVSGLMRNLETVEGFDSYRGVGHV